VSDRRLEVAPAHVPDRQKADGSVFINITNAEQQRTALNRSAKGAS